MGLTGFHQNTKHLLQTNKSLHEFAGKRVGIDASGWLHRSAVVHSREYFLGLLGDDKPWCEFVQSMLQMIKRHGLTPIMVFDGPERLPLKDDTRHRRSEKRETAWKEGVALEVTMDVEESKKKFMQAFSVTHDIERDAMALCDELDVPFKIAQYEADVELASLFHNGEIDLVISEDSDLVAYGVSKIIFKLRLSEEFDFLDTDWEYQEDSIKKKGTTILLHPLTDTQKALLATFIGNDYLSNPPKMGIKKVYNLVRECTCFDQMVLGLQKHVDMDEEYYTRAKKVFDLFTTYTV